MKKSIFFTLLFILVTLTSSKADKENQKIVYTCTNSEVKCYLYKTCDKLVSKCNLFRGKIYKMQEQEAKNMGKVLCSCGEVK